MNDEARPAGRMTWTGQPERSGPDGGTVPLDGWYAETWPQSGQQPGAGQGPAGSGEETQPLPVLPAVPGGGPARPGLPRRRTRLFTGAAAGGICAGIAIVTLAGTQAIRIIPADNPSAAGQYTPAAGPASPPAASTPPAASPSPSPSAAAGPAPLTRTEAGQILAGYWTANNAANQARSDRLLAAIEAGTSYRIDADAYRTGQAEDPANTRYVPLTGQDTAIWIPRQPAGEYPRWFAARVSYADARTGHITAAGYLVFNQSQPGGPWRSVLEPYLLPARSGPGAFVAADAQGYAAEAAVTPGQVEDPTAASLDGSSDAVQDPGNLADVRDARYFAARLPAGSAAADQHEQGGMVFALRTVSGGTLVFYSLTARVTLAPPDGQAITIGIPGYYTPAEPVTSPVIITYAEQFAAYLPPGQASPVLLADASGITG